MVEKVGGSAKQNQHCYHSNAGLYLFDDYLNQIRHLAQSCMTLTQTVILVVDPPTRRPGCHPPLAYFPCPYSQSCFGKWSVLVNDGRRHTSTVFFVLLVVVLNLLTDLVVGCARRQFLLVSLNMTRS